jgi:Zn-dependent alcohol dehydrogenase
MPDKTVRYKCQGKDVYHFMGCSSFSEYSVVCEIIFLHFLMLIKIYFIGLGNFFM